MNKLPLNPTDSKRFLGNVMEVTPTTVKIQISKTSSPEGSSSYGNRSSGVEVGHLVFIECGDMLIFGTVVSVDLFEIKNDLSKEYKCNTIGTVQLNATINLKTGEVERGIKRYPRIGCKSYSAHPDLIRWVAEATSRKDDIDNPVILNIAYLQDYTDTQVRLLPEQLFGRHCAILGTTGGGKSWTIARLVEEVGNHRSKAILLDPGGEFYTLDKEVTHLHFGEEESNNKNSREVVIPYTSLTERDLFTIFNPSGLQVPKLRAAMKSLKLARLEPWLTRDGVIVKANQQRTQYEQIYRQYASIIESPSADFDIRYLNHQIEEECIWNTNRTFPSKWGGYNDDERSSCVSLISRIEDVLSSPELACIFNVKGKKSVLTEIDKFLADEDTKILRISLENVSFSHNAREVIVNSIGRYILGKARKGCFRQNPLILFLDEAHHFLNKSVDEDSKYRLDSFELIAKEGRKFSLNICIATQRPRDIPEGVLSQMGTIIVHRLINDNDRDVVERACGEFNQSLTSFLPNFVPGEALIIGVDFPIPVTMKVWEPTYQPDSRGPCYQKYWE